jgi:iron complex transport system permease protein
MVGAVNDVAAGRRTTATDILFLMRLPRILTGAAVGALLAATGAALQAFLRNPLADPYLLGVSGGASLGSAVGLLLGVAAPAPFAVAGALATLVAVLGLARAGGAPRPTLLILAGAGIHSFSSAILTLILSQARRQDANAVLFWLLGSLDSLPYGKLVPLLVGTVIVLSALWACAPALNLLSQGEDTARALGLSVEKAQWGLVTLCALSTGLVVTFNGALPFVGLMVPHAARMIGGFDLRRSLPLSAFLGALLVVLSDALGRGVIAPREIPVGVVTALVGAPVFLALLWRLGRREP